jgi:hypothetical protein
MGKLTKAAMVRAFDDGTRTTKEIAAIVGVLPEYVRAVRHREIAKVCGDRDVARAAGKAAYRAARKAGRSLQDAAGMCGSAYTSALCKSAREMADAA